jgi:hypothetical protein
LPSSLAKIWSLEAQLSEHETGRATPSLHPEFTACYQLLRDLANEFSIRLTPELIAECERVVSKTFPACVAFHKPSFVQQLKSASLDAALVYGLLTCAARYVTSSEPCLHNSLPVCFGWMCHHADRRLISHLDLTRPSARHSDPHRSVAPSPSV